MPRAPVQRQLQRQLLFFSVSAFDGIVPDRQVRNPVDLLLVL